MSKQRLNITLDPEVIERARRYSRRHQTSISHLIGEFLSALPGSEGDAPSDLTPAVRRLLGVAKGGPDRDDHRAHLMEKYGV